MVSFTGASQEVAMRVLFMGQTGIDKKRHIETLIDLCKERGVTIDGVFHIGIYFSGVE